MSELIITTKDDVVCLVTTDIKDSSIVLGANYFRWVLGSVRESDALYWGKVMGGPVSGHTIEQIQKALVRVSDERIFPPLPIPWWFAHTSVTVAASWDVEPDPDAYYLKRPWIVNLEEELDPPKQSNTVAMWFAHEIKQLERLARHPPHPNLVRYHGCRVRHGRITGALLGRVPGDELWIYLQAGKTVDKDPFLAALASAVDHLHNVIGLVHNDIHPGNIMVSPDGVPTLVDMGAAYPDGEEMTQAIAFGCWGGDPLDMDPETYYDGPRMGSPTSRKSRDLAALKQLHAWLDNPVDPWDTTIARQQVEMAACFVEVGNKRSRAAAARREASSRAAEHDEAAA
ncbi:kinase-like domain-containing protein [Lasiosphaeria hispida]|uniref:Kinase-like domain-containing protein n=1 Tax=Lasiosphaeria hispida TaxID=260671 RepID=A0AAJ0H4N5_9PEZI|nr:kinase-like domain-containing protein [Lasiosphaeria hispida]KAK3338619.1 kinase-like domain-containing protein [Lasiosphaeria hispida]KAK3343624.1 kinase-like domain-containing protein [Lasiosphaeria hispida]